MELRENISLKAFNTFHIDVKARFYAEVHAPDDLHALFSARAKFDYPVLILGGGSNILFTRDFDGLVVRMAMKGILPLETDDKTLRVKAFAGENWDGLVMHCVQNGWGGIENLSLIPGTVGGAPVQNIGAYGVELKEVVDEVEVFDMVEGSYRTYSSALCEFGYRTSRFKQQAPVKSVITSITLRLTRHPVFRMEYGTLRQELERLGVKTITLQAMRQAVCHIRSNRLPDPDVTGNAGSFFKNPLVPLSQMEVIRDRYPGVVVYPQPDGRYKLAAGWLIDQCGWKGYRAGEAGVHDKQALVLVNHGRATGSEILQLSARIRESVMERFQVLLEPEVTIV